MKTNDLQSPASNRQAGKVQLTAMVAIALLLGVGAGALWWFKGTPHSADGGAVHEADASDTVLSEGTRAVVEGLAAPVEIRYFALLDRAGTSDSLRSFAARVDQLLAEYEKQSGGLIEVVRVTSPSADNAQAAASAGIRAFNLDKGDACFLGLTVSGEGQTEVMPRLSEEWEQALEFDLSRALARVSQKSASSVSLADASRVDHTAAEQLMRSRPELGSVSFDDGAKILREAALAEFKAVADELQSRLQAVEGRLSQAPGADSDVARKAASELQQIRDEQARKAQAIASRLQLQIAALERIKSDAR